MTASSRTPSFDVFDTVLTRRTGRNPAVFDVLAQRLHASGALPAPPAALAGTRWREEARLHTVSGRAPRLLDIYSEVARRLSLPPEQVPLLAAAEEDVERELSVVVPGAEELLAAGRATSSDGTLVFVSDTPLSGAFVSELLERQGLLGAGDRVFTSSDLGVSKARGGLFRAVAEQLGRPAEQFLHTGDDARSDVASGRAEGWRTTYRPRARLNRYEKLLDKRPGETAGLGARLAGASRLARLRARERGVPAAVADVAAGVVAPVLIGYVLWLAAQARERGLSRLYFVSRDGEALLEVARPLLAVLAPEVECRYLYGSRQSWMLAGSGMSEDVLAAWLAPKPESTARTALARAGLDVEEIWRETRLSWADPATADRPLSVSAAQGLSQDLLQEPLRSRILRQAQDSAELALAYVRQEGFTDGIASGLVDLGWRGHSARAFDQLVRQVGGRPVHHMFVGLFEAARVVRSAPDAPSMSVWLFDQDAGRVPDARSFTRPNVVLEMFCAGSEGRVLRYGRDGDVVVPVLTEPRNTLVLDWGLAQVREVVADVVAGCADVLTESHLHVDLVEPAWDVLHAFWMQPTRAEAEAWGSFPWEEETYPPVYPLAQQLGHAGAARRIALRGRGIPVNSWRAGTARLQKQPWRSILLLRELEDRQKSLSRRVRRGARLTAGRLRR